MEHLKKFFVRLELQVKPYLHYEEDEDGRDDKDDMDEGEEFLCKNAKNDQI